MEAEPQRDTGGSSPPIPPNIPASASIHGHRGDSEVIPFAGSSSSDVGLAPMHESINTVAYEMNKPNQMKQDDFELFTDSDWEMMNSKLHSLRLILLNELLIYMPRLRDVGM